MSFLLPEYNKGVLPMPKTKRDLLKRQLAHAHNNCTLAMQHTLTVKTAFDGQHPELGAVLDAALESIDLAQGLLERFIVAAWGHLPDGWEKWRNTDDKS